MEIQGRVIAILEPQRFVSKKNGNEYVTTVFVIETPGQYPKKVAMKAMGEDKFKQMGIVMGGIYFYHLWHDYRYLSSCTTT